MVSRAGSYREVTEAIDHGRTMMALVIPDDFGRRVASERQKRSVIPVSFWYLSMVGSLLLLAYGFYVKQPVYIAGYLFNCIVYVRNLHLIHARHGEA